MNHFSGIQWTIQAAQKCKSLNSLIGAEAMGFCDGWDGKEPWYNSPAATIDVMPFQSAYHYGYAQGMIDRTK
jgi:hypothetical protein